MWKVHNSQKRLTIDLAFANQTLISGIREMKHTWFPKEVSDHAMVLNFKNSLRIRQKILSHNPCYDFVSVKTDI